MIDFYKKQTEIENYIQETFNDYLTEKSLSVPDKYTNESIDLDKFRNNTTVFFAWTGIDFDNLSNETQNQKQKLEVAFCCRNGTENDLQKKAFDLASNFYNWFYDSARRDFGGLIDYGTITTVEPYTAAEANKFIKFINIVIELNLED